MSEKRPRSNSRLISLPEDNLVHVLEYLSGIDLAHFALTKAGAAIDTETVARNICLFEGVSDRHIPGLEFFDFDQWSSSQMVARSDGSGSLGAVGGVGAGVSAVASAAALKASSSDEGGFGFGGDGGGGGGGDGEFGGGSGSGRGQGGSGGGGGCGPCGPCGLWGWTRALHRLDGVPRVVRVPFCHAKVRCTDSAITA